MGGMRVLHMLFVFGVCYMSTHVFAYSATDAVAVRTEILTNYSSKVRPTATTEVDVQFGMMHITELNIVNQQLHIVGFIVVLWEDSRLTWIPGNHGNMDSIFLLLSDIWSPPLVLNNAANEIKVMNDNTNLASVHIIVTSNGGVVWLAPASFISQCTINIKYYPFDSQRCHIKVSSWLFLNTDIQITSSATSINLDLYEENGEWDLTQSAVKNTTRVLFGHELPAVQFTTVLTRKYSYYLMNMLLPVIILAVMAPFVFVLPVESGEKIGFALTILLSLSVVMTLVSDNIPPTSTHICVLNDNHDTFDCSPAQGYSITEHINACKLYIVSFTISLWCDTNSDSCVYLLLTFVLCSVQTVITVLTCRIHAFHDKGFKMGNRLTNLARLLSRITRYSRNHELEFEHRIMRQDTRTGETNMNGTSELPTRARKNKAWSDDDEKVMEKSNAIVALNYEDMACMCDKFLFVAFTVITLLKTLIFMIVLRAGG